jgi:hypothetical protein
VECRNGDLHSTVENDGADGGHASVALRFTNVSGRTCFVQGYPGAELVDASGSAQADAQRTLHGFIDTGVIGATDPGITAPPRVTLRPGESAIAILEWETEDDGDCLVRQSSSLLFTAPDSTESTAMPGLRDVCKDFEIGPVLLDNAMG